MGGKVDEVLDSMTPVELSALEAELDKRASEDVVGHYLSIGAELARSNFAAIRKSGELTPVLHLVKASADDEKGEEKKKDEKSEKKLPPWLKKDDDKDDKKSEKDEKDKDEKDSSEVDAILEKASAEDLAKIEAELDEKLAEIEYAKHYEALGRKLAHDPDIIEKLAKSQFLGGSFSAGKSVIRAMGGAGKARSTLAPMSGVGRSVGQFFKNHPVAGGVLAGVGGTLLAEKVLDR